uniref:Dihydrolipoyl dehydrogenase n=2 Tax=Paratrimastix pyriformis TaxID=342808 RepID=B0F477_9EUKA|nr:glycine cleavage system L-protein [Paratrimastix pyriformis]
MQSIVVIGGGPGGYVAAIKAAQLGFKVTCVEKRGALGGTCLNVGCIPSKALLQASHEYVNAQKHFTKLGIRGGNGVSFSVPEIMKHKQGCVKASCDGIEHLFNKYNVTYVKGEGSLAGPHEVRVRSQAGDAKVMRADHIIIATGSDVFTLPSMPIDEKIVVSSTGALSFSEVPKRLVVVGAGVIGLELGSVWSRLGSQVSVVELTPNCLPEMDRELGNTLQRCLSRQGMKFHMQSLVTGIATNPAKGTAIVKFESKKGPTPKKDQMEADKVLIAIGRAPFTKGLGLKELGIATDRRGFVQVDGRYRTSVPSVYAIGDAIPGPMLAHKAEEDGVACVEMIAKAPHAQPVDYSIIPGVVYTHPEVGSVGRSEEQLKKAGVAYRKGVFPFMANGRARANADTDGFVKVLADVRTDKILGVHTIGGVAGEAIAEGVVAMKAGWTAAQLGDCCHAHPTLSEAVKEAAMAAHHLPLHM